jgi:hypothetical protein
MTSSHDDVLVTAYFYGFSLIILNEVILYHVTLPVVLEIYEIKAKLSVS